MEGPENEHTEDQCLVCLNPPREEEPTWTCTCCHKKCHMLCIFQWTLRLSLNHSRHLTSFTCPGCRTSHVISTLPGFEQQHTQTTTTRTTTRTRRHAAGANGTAAQLLQRAFGLTAHIQGGARNENENENEDEDQDDETASQSTAILEIEEQDQESDDDDDDDEDDQDDGDDGGRFICSVTTEKIYFTVGELIVNIHSR